MKNERHELWLACHNCHDWAYQDTGQQLHHAYDWFLTHLKSEFAEVAIQPQINTTKRFLRCGKQGVLSVCVYSAPVAHNQIRPTCTKDRVMDLWAMCLSRPSHAEVSSTRADSSRSRASSTT